MLGRAWAWRQADGCPTAAPGVPPTPLSVLGTVHRPWMFVGPKGPRVFLAPLGQTSARREYSSEAAQNNERLRFFLGEIRPKASDNQFLGRAMENFCRFMTTSHHAPAQGRLWSLAWPMMLSNLSLPALTLVDAAVLGHLPEPQHLAAVVLGSTLFSFFYWGFGFLRMGTTGQVAQLLGAASAQPPRVTGRALRKLLGQGFGVAGIATAGCWLLGPFLIPEALGWLNGRGAVAEEGERYALIRLFSAPAVLVTYVMVGTLIGLGETRRVLALTVFTQALNIGFDLLFVLGLGMAGPGVALGTALAEGLGALFAASQLRPALKRWPGSMPWQGLRQGYGAFLRVNGDLFLRTLTLLLCLSVFTAQGAGLGTAVVAANALLMNLFMAVSYGLDGIAHGCETLVGQALGRRDLKEARAWVWLALKLAFGGAVASTAIFWAFGPELIALLTDIDHVATTGEAALPWLLALPLLAAGAFVLDGVFIGSTQSAALRNTMLASAGLIYAPALMVLSPYGNAGLWSALALFFLARSVSLGWVYGRGGLALPPA